MQADVAAWMGTGLHNGSGPLQPVLPLRPGPRRRPDRLRRTVLQQREGLVDAYPDARPPRPRGRGRRRYRGSARGRPSRLWAAARLQHLELCILVRDTRGHGRRSGAVRDPTWAGTCPTAAYGKPDTAGPCHELVSSQVRLPRSMSTRGASPPAGATPPGC